MKSEAEIQNLVRIEASEKGYRLWRNNVGAAYMQDGSFLRYGLANESTSVNKIIKSSDLIGIKPILITQEYVGHKIGQFVSLEIKRADWKYSGNERELAQHQWLQLINRLGGLAMFVNNEGFL